MALSGTVLTHFILNKVTFFKSQSEVTQGH